MCKMSSEAIVDNEAKKTGNIDVVNVFPTRVEDHDPIRAS